MELEEKTNLKRLISMMKKNSITIVLVLLLFILCGYFYSYYMIVPRYKSTSTILLSSNNTTGDSTAVTQADVTLNKSLISTYGKILTSNKVLSKVIENLNINMTESELMKSIQLEAVGDTQIMKVSVTNENATEAQKIAEELNNVFIEEIKQFYNMDNISIVDHASFDDVPYNINHIKDLLLFAGAGLIFSMLLISVVFLFDTTIKLEQDIEDFVGLNVIGSVPECNMKRKKDEIVASINSKSNISEALRTIRTNLSFTKLNGNIRSILFTSCNTGEGKSWIAANMAVTYAQSNKNVIIVDADMRKGRQHNIFKVPNASGLSSCLSEIEAIDDYKTLEMYIKETNIPKVHILPIGTIPPNPSELLLSNNLNYLLHMLKCMYDVVIIDGTPCNLVSDSIPISRIVDTTIIVAESRKTKIEDLKKLAKSIKNVKGNIAGVILNKKEVKNKEYKKGYYYGKRNSNGNVELETHTVKELIAGKKEYIEEIVSREERDMQEQQIDLLTDKIANIQNENMDILTEKMTDMQNESLDVLTEKLLGLENKISEIPNLNVEAYMKLVDGIREIYDKEIDKNKLAIEIKDNIIKNEIEKKLDEKDNTQFLNNILTEIENVKKVQKQNIDEMANDIKINSNNKMEEMANDIKINSNNKIEEIANELKLDNKEKLEKIDNTEFLHDMLVRFENAKREQRQELLEVSADIKLQNDKKVEELDNSEFMHNVLMEIESIKREQSKQIEEMIEDIKLENEKSIERIDNSIQMEKIMQELQKINNKYKKLEDEIIRDKDIKKVSKNSSNGEEKIISTKNNVIEISELRKKANKEELVIEYGDIIDYEQLLDLAIETYEIKSNQDTGYYISSI